jgi:Antitoxin Xre/MbcA/ParS C-terminal toxin-binding domain
MHKTAQNPDDQTLVTHAFVNAGRALGMPLAQLAQVIGVGESTMKNYSRGGAAIKSGKNLELSLGFIRVYRALYAILGGNLEQMQHWMRTPNLHLRQQVPAELAVSYQGLAELNVYLDAVRGRL